MGSVTLKFQYGGRSVDVFVQDVDRSLLFDVINDYEEQAEALGIPKPKYPSFSYVKQTNHVNLIKDNDIYDLYSFMEKQKLSCIDIWVGELQYLSEVVGGARSLRVAQQKNNESSQVSLAMIEAPTNRGKLLTSPDVLDTFLDVWPSAPWPTETPLPSTPPSLSSPPKKFPQKLTPPLRTSPRFQTLSTNATQGLDDIASLSQKPVTSQILSSHILSQARKIPKTTALRRGVTVPNMTQSQNLKDKVVVTTKKTGMRSSHNQGNDVEFEECDDDYTDEADSEFEPSESDEEHSVGESMTLVDEDDDADNELQYVEDLYEPNTGHCWYVDEDCYFSKLYNNGELYDGEEFGSVKLKERTIFLDKEHFKSVLTDYCIQEGFALVIFKSDQKRFTAECSYEGCEWRVHASILPDDVTWAIKSIKNEHNYIRLDGHNPMATMKWVAAKLMDDIRAQPTIPVKALEHILYERFGLTMKKSTMYKMRNWALHEIQGGHDISYAKLPVYCEVIKETNPGSTAHCVWFKKNDPERSLVFKSIFISFDGSIQGCLKGCRGFIGVDGTHLKGNYLGILLTAVALDGNNQIFPVAHAVVDSETRDSWYFFFYHLKTILCASGRTSWTIISDRQKGIDPALDDIWPEAGRRYCMKHLCVNFKKTYKGPLMHTLFWRCVNAYSEFTFNKACEKLVEEAGVEALQWLKDVGPEERWARHKFNAETCSDENTSNFVESFNASIGADRCLPILSLLEGVRRLSMVRIATRQQDAEKWDINGVCPNIMKQLDVLSKDSRTCRVFKSSRGEFEIADGRSQLPVSLNHRSCACGQWQISGVPCRHALRAIIYNRENPQSYVNEWYSVKIYSEAYGKNINPIADCEQWPQFELPSLQPPEIKRGIGRPSRERRRGEGEPRKGKKASRIRCKKCRAFGHNARSCKGGATAKELRATGGSSGQVTQLKKGGRKRLPDTRGGEASSSSQLAKQRKVIKG